MANLKLEFQAELKEKCQEAEALGAPVARLLERAEKYGAVETLAESWRKGRTSDVFGKLAELGRLELAPEAMATKGKYGALFDDDAVNYCLEMLCEAGYYQL